MAIQMHAPFTACEIASLLHQPPELKPVGLYGEGRWDFTSLCLAQNMVSRKSRSVCSTPQPCAIGSMGAEHFQNPLSLYLTYVISYLLRRWNRWKKWKGWVGGTKVEVEEVGFAISTLFGCCLVGQSSTADDTPLMFSVPSAWSLQWKG